MTYIPRAHPSNRRTTLIKPLPAIQACADTSKERGARRYRTNIVCGVHIPPVLPAFRPPAHADFFPSSSIIYSTYSSIVASTNTQGPTSITQLRTTKKSEIRCPHLLSAHRPCRLFSRHVCHSTYSSVVEYTNIPKHY